MLIKTIRLLNINIEMKRFVYSVLSVMAISSLSGCDSSKNSTEDRVENHANKDLMGSIQDLTDYGEPFPIDVVKECIYYNGGNEPQKNIRLNNLIGEWEFERDIKVTYIFKPDRNYTEIREGYLMDEDNKSKPSKKIKSGNFTFKDNVLTLLDYNSKDELHPADWKKYKNPLNKELVVFSLKGDTLSLYESGIDTYKYTKKR